MRGRPLLAVFLLGSSLSLAQAPAPLPRIAFVANTVPRADLETRTPSHPAAKLVESGLRELGWTDGRNVTFVWRSAEGDDRHLPAIMDEVVAMKVDVIVAFGPGVVEAARKTRTIPIVMGSIGHMEAEDPLARPNRNVTGLTLADSSALDGKRLALLKEASPRVRRVAILDVAPRAVPVAFREEVRTAASALGIELVAARVEHPDEFEAAIASAVQRGANALLVAEFPHAHWPEYQRAIHAAALAHRLPVVHSVLSAADSGGLLAYGTDILENYRRTPYFVDRILRGAKPSDLPIEQPSRYELVINRAAARAIGLTLPPALLARADRVVD